MTGSNSKLFQGVAEFILQIYEWTDAYNNICTNRKMVHHTVMLSAVSWLSL